MKNISSNIKPFSRQFLRSKLLLSVILLCTYGSHAQEAKRIVSLAASVTKNLYLLNAQDNIIGCTRFCVTDPADSIPVVADAVNINLEKIALLHPDLVFVSDLTHPRTVEALEKMGVRTIRLNQPRNFEEICSQLEIMGEHTGKKALAQQINDECRKRLDAVRKNIPTNGSPKVFMEIGADPLFTALHNTFMHDYIIQSGGINIAEKLHSGMISKEFVLLQNPDIIFITGMGLLSGEEKKNWEKISSISAVKKKRVFTLDEGVCSPTPVVFVETIEEMARLMR